jgi:hypothetical protein
MGARIEFRGNILFRHDGEALHEILLPKCEPPKDMKTFPDTDIPAVRHYAGMLVASPGENPFSREYYDLTDSSVVIGPPGAPGSSSAFKRLAHVPGSDGIEVANVTSRVVVTSSGRWVDTKDHNGFSYAHKGTDALVMWMSYVLSSEECSIRVVSREHGAHDIPIKPDARVFIYSNRSLLPLVSELMRHDHSAEPHSDVDFVWMHRLYRSPKDPHAMPWKGRIGTYTVNVSTCFPGGGS